MSRSSLIRTGSLVVIVVLTACTASPVAAPARPTVGSAVTPGPGASASPSATRAASPTPRAAGSAFALVALPSATPGCSDPSVLAHPPGMPAVDPRGIGYTDELISAARDWLKSTSVRPGIAGHLLVPADVTESNGSAYVTFHDYDSGTQLRVALAASDAHPSPLRVEDAPSAPTGLSPYERVCFEAAVEADPATVLWLGADASTASRLEFSQFAVAPCPSEPGFCGSAVVMSANASYPYLPHVTVDLRTARVICYGS
jgi:hypothetical protein